MGLVSLDAQEDRRRLEGENKQLSVAVQVSLCLPLASASRLLVRFSLPAIYGKCSETNNENFNKFFSAFFFKVES